MADKSIDVLYDLVGMNLHPKVYAPLREKLRKLGNRI